MCTIDPKSNHYNEKSHLAKTARLDESGQIVWGNLPGGSENACSARLAEHDLHRLPLVLEPELLRLPPAAEGQQEDAIPPLRGGCFSAITLSTELPDPA